MIKKYTKGSFTVEVTLLMPIVLMVILVMFFFVLYMYNRGVMQNAVCRGAKQVFYCENDDNDAIKKECARVVLTDLENSLVGVKEPEVKVQVSSNRIEIVLKGQLNVPQLLAPEGTVFEDLWDYEICGEEWRINPAKVIRNGQQLEGVWEEIKPEVVEDGSEI